MALPSVSGFAAMAETLAGSSCRGLGAHPLVRVVGALVYEAHAAFLELAEVNVARGNDVAPERDRVRFGHFRHGAAVVAFLAAFRHLQSQGRNERGAFGRWGGNNDRVQFFDGSAGQLKVLLQVGAGLGFAEGARLQGVVAVNVNFDRSDGRTVPAKGGVGNYFLSI